MKNLHEGFLHRAFPHLPRLLQNSWPTLSLFQGAEFPLMNFRLCDPKFVRISFFRLHEICIRGGLMTHETFLGIATLSMSKWRNHTRLKFKLRLLISGIRAAAEVYHLSLSDEEFCAAAAAALLCKLTSHSLISRWEGRQAPTLSSPPLSPVKILHWKTNEDVLRISNFKYCQPNLPKYCGPLSTYLRLCREQTEICLLKGFQSTSPTLAWQGDVTRTTSHKESSLSPFNIR